MWVAPPESWCSCAPGNVRCEGWAGCRGRGCGAAASVRGRGSGAGRAGRAGRARRCERAAWPGRCVTRPWSAARSRPATRAGGRLAAARSARPSSPWLAVPQTTNPDDKILLSLFLVKFAAKYQYHCEPRNSLMSESLIKSLFRLVQRNKFQLH